MISLQICQTVVSSILHCHTSKWRMSRIMTKPTKWHVRPAKTQISLDIRPDRSESSLSAWRKLGSLATQWAHSKDWSDWADSDQSLRWTHTHFLGFLMRCLIWCRVCLWMQNLGKGGTCLSPPIIYYRSICYGPLLWWLFLLFVFDQRFIHFKID